MVTTTTQIGDFASSVGGDQISLTVLLKPNQDAHDFAPQPSQVRAMADADVILRNGVGLDAYVNKAVGNSPRARVTIVTSGLVLRHASENGEEAGNPEAAKEAGGQDPHVWFSVQNAQRMVENIRDAFASADPANAAFYGGNAGRYLASLDGLDTRIRTQVGQMPAGCRKLVTNHDTLAYYGAAYGFDIVGAVIPSVSTEAKPSASDVADIVRKIRSERVPAIFAEVSINPALIRQVGREAGVKVVDDLYGDSLGPKGSSGATYIGMMDTNTKKIVDALKTC